MAILVPIVVYFVCMLVVLAVGVGTGFLLHWLLPAIDVGAAVIASTVAAAFGGYVIFNILAGLLGQPPTEPDDEASEAPVVYLVDALPGQRSRRKRKR